MYCDSINVETLKNLLETVDGKTLVQVNIISTTIDQLRQIKSVRLYEEAVVLEVIYD